MYMWLCHTFFALPKIACCWIYGWFVLGWWSPKVHTIILPKLDNSLPGYPKFSLHISIYFIWCRHGCMHDLLPDMLFGIFVFVAHLSIDHQRIHAELLCSLRFFLWTALISAGSVHPENYVNTSYHYSKPTTSSITNDWYLRKWFAKMIAKMICENDLRKWCLRKCMNTHVITTCRVSVFLKQRTTLAPSRFDQLLQIVG